MLYNTLSGRPLQSPTPGIAQIRQPPLASQTQTRTTSTSGTVPSQERACNSEAWTVTCRESARMAPGMGLKSEESTKIDLKYLRPRFAQKGPSMRSGKEPYLPVLVLAAGWIHYFW